MRIKTLAALSVIFCVAATADIYGQSTVSPYSLFGIGEIDMGNWGETTGMGGLGIGIYKPNTLNTSNPAALAGIEPTMVVFDGALFGKVAWYTGQGRQEATGTGNIRRLGIGLRVMGRWALSAGLTPFSSVGYNIRKSSPIEGSAATMETTFLGEGGFSRLYLAQAFSITRNLSLGVNSSFIFGTTDHTESSAYWTSIRTSQGRKIYFEFGLQYNKEIKRNLAFTLGLVGGYKARVSMSNKVLTYDYDGVVAQDKVLPSSEQYIPEYYGGGASLRLRRFTLGVDYVFQKWSRIDSGASAIKYKDMNKLTAGVSYTPDLYDARSYGRRISYQFGVSANDSYLAVSGQSGINYSVSTGLVLPLRDYVSSAYIGIEYGRNAFPARTRSSIRENYFKFTLGFSFKQKWFIKQYYD